MPPQVDQAGGGRSNPIFGQISRDGHNSASLQSVRTQKEF
jgi:hypothetical protein